MLHNIVAQHDTHTRYRPRTTDKVVLTLALNQKQKHMDNQRQLSVIHSIYSSLPSISVADPVGGGGRGGHGPSPGPVKISHKKDGHRR